MYEVTQQRSPTNPRILKSSLIDATLHPPEVLEMVNLKMSHGLREYIVQLTIDTVDYALGYPSTSTSEGTATRSRSRSPNYHHTDFARFVDRVVDKADVTVPVLLVTLVYLDRAKAYLSIALEEWAYERTFLGALIVADKFCNDVTLKNIHWATCSGVFDKRDIGLIEREFLGVLDFELMVSESDLLTYHDPIMAHLHHSNHHVHIHRPHIHVTAANIPEPRAVPMLVDASACEVSSEHSAASLPEAHISLPCRTSNSPTPVSTCTPKPPRTDGSVHSNTSSATLTTPPKPHSHRHLAHQRSFVGTLHSLKSLAWPHWSDCLRGRSSPQEEKRVEGTDGDTRIPSLSVMVSIPMS